MVFISATLRCVKKPFKKSRFIDTLRILVKGGSGGHGLPRLGGIGGDGGDVIVEGDSGTTLKALVQKIPSKRVVAGHGENSLKNRLSGTRGEDFNIKVPLGITVYNDKGQTLGEVNKEGEKVLVAKGGAGGSKNSGFSGLKGEKFVMSLDLKLIADVGLVGFPNAGKSSLLTVVSNAKPKIASYPFTTIQPYVGTLSYPDLRRITMADLPGLIEGAHANVGMGHKFLKHVERTKLLLLVVDVSGFQLGLKYKKRTAVETLILLNKELELYKEELLDKPALLVVNKMDLPDSKANYELIRSAAQDLQAVFHLVPDSFKPERPLTFHSILAMSAKSNNPEEVDRLRTTVRQILDETTEDVDDEDLKLFQKIDNEYRRRGPILV